MSTKRKKHKRQGFIDKLREADDILFRGLSRQALAQRARENDQKIKEFLASDSPDWTRFLVTVYEQNLLIERLGSERYSPEEES